METSRTKIAGPAIAAGAVSLGLVLIGACGIGSQDTYVAPPPLQSDLNVAPAAVRQGTPVTSAKIMIPPSPTWRIAPYQAPPASPFTGFATTTTGVPPAEEPHGYPPHEGPPSSEDPVPTTESPTRTPTTARPTTRPPSTTEEPEPTTARPRPSGSPSAGQSTDPE